DVFLGKLTEAEKARMTMKEKSDIMKFMYKKQEQIRHYIEESIRTLLFCGRKNSLSIINVGHKYKAGPKQVTELSESTSAIFYPNSVSKTVLEEFLLNRMSMGKPDTQYIMKEMTFYKFEWLYVNQTGKLFIMTNNKIKIL